MRYSLETERSFCHNASVMENARIWLDDVRECPSGFVWFRSVDGFVNWCLHCHVGMDFSDVDVVDADHDAGEYAAFGGDYVRAFDWLEANGARNVTVRVHSMNPVGRENVERLVRRNSARGWRLAD